MKKLVLKISRPASKLPNIKYYKDYGWRMNSFSIGSRQVSYGRQDTVNKDCRWGGDSIIVDINASRSSSIYTDGWDRVQPNSTNIFYYIKLM